MSGVQRAYAARSINFTTWIGCAAEWISVMLRWICLAAATLSEPFFCVSLVAGVHWIDLDSEVTRFHHGLLQI